MPPILIFPMGKKILKRESESMNAEQENNYARIINYSKYWNLYSLSKLSGPYIQLKATHILQYTIFISF